MDPSKEPSRQDRLKLSEELQRRFQFSRGQAGYLAYNAYGYCRDLLDEIHTIENSMSILQTVLKGIGLS